MKKIFMITCYLLLALMLFAGDVDSVITDYVEEVTGQYDDQSWPEGGSPTAEKLPMIFDNDSYTKYLVKAEASWLDLYTDILSRVTSYSITSANDSPMRDPNSWILQGWDADNDEWITVHSVTNQSAWEDRFQTKSWTVKTSKWFSSYRLQITAINGSSDGLMQVAELQLFGELGDFVDIQKPQKSGYSSSDNESEPVVYIGNCNTDRLNIRNSAGTGGKVIGVLLQNEIVQVVEKTTWTQKIDGLAAPWVKVVSDNYEGWVYGGFISTAQFVDGKFSAAGTIYDPSSNISLEAGIPVAHTANSANFKMHYVPGGGTFTMGEHDNWTSPQSVTLKKNFWIGETEVTQGLWEEVWGSTWPGEDPDGTGLGPFVEFAVGSGADYPAYFVNFYDAAAFCNLLTLADNSITGAEQVYYADKGLTTAYTKVNAANKVHAWVDWNKTGYRLPSEAEWEYAARYIDGNSWNNGDHVSGDTEYASIAVKSGITASGSPMASDARIEEYAQRGDQMAGGPQRVGQKKANALGLRDMSGNIAEWCYTYDPSFSTEGKAPILRGGYWYDRVNCAYRDDYIEPNDRWASYGFRLCRTAE